MKIIYTIIILSSAFTLSSFGQDLNLTSESPTISAGAEYSLFLQKMIKSGNADKFKFNGTTVRLIEPNDIDAITFFDGFNFNDNGIETGYVFIPPDPCGVAGTDRVIAVGNVLIECRNKSGSLLWRDALRDFFSTLSVPAGNFTFDPKVIYDQYEDRFVVVDLEHSEADPPANPSTDNTSRILLAVSKTNAPATPTSADWYYYAINAKEVVGGFDYWADYPGFAIDEEAVYITANLFVEAPYAGGLAYTRLWIVNKGTTGGFYDGGTPSVTGGWDFPTLSGGSAGTHQPAHVFDTGGVATGVGTFLVSYGGLSTGGVGGSEAIQVIRVDDPLGSPSFSSQFVFMGDIENVGGSYGFPSLPDAPQSGTGTTIEVNDRRALHAVWRNNSLWLTTTINPNSGPDVGETTAHWVQLNTTTLGSTTLTDQGNIGGENIASDTYTFFPSIAVNSAGDAIIGFSASASSIFPGAYYAGRFSGDPAGTVNPSVVVRAGTDYYVRTFGGSRNRWGDYTMASIDPSDGSFWVFNQYATTRAISGAPEDGRWGTVYANVPIGELPVELTSFSASVIGPNIKLSWETSTEVNNYGFDVERMSHVNDQTSENWTKIGFVNGNGNSNSPKNYSFQDKDALSGKYSYRLKQIDNDGQFEYSKTIEVDLGAPKKFELSQNYPNPFNPSTTIRYSLPEAGNVKLTLFNILGQEIKTLVNESKEAGVHTINFNASELNSGLYIYKIEANGFTQTRKMTLIK